MRIKNIFKTKISHRKVKININPIVLGIIVFIFTFFYMNYWTQKNLIPQQTYNIDSIDVAMPIIYQERKGHKINELRGFSNGNYNIVSNETQTFLENDRRLNLLVKNNGSKFVNFEYEVRDKNSNTLIERTKLDVSDFEYDAKKDETKISLHIQNLILQETTYLLTMKIDLGTKKAYYFTNIISRRKVALDDAIEKATEFTLNTLDSKKASSIVQYLETSINRDTREMHTVTLQQTFEQLTFANTDMKLMSELYYNIYQAQEYSFNIEINYFTKSGNAKKDEFFVNKDEYVLRYDGKRWYYMKFTRSTEELINFDKDSYSGDKKRLYVGVTNPNNFYKYESENKKYFAFVKEKDIYEYDVDNENMTNVFSYNIKSEEQYARISKDYDVKIMDIADNGDITYIVYGYNMWGLNEGNMGIGIYTYDVEANVSEEKLFLPIYTTYQSLRYDIDRLCVYKNNRLIFKSNNKVFSVDVDTAEILAIAEGFEETKFVASENSRYFAFNNDKEGKSKSISIYNIDDGKVTTIKPNGDENIEVVTFMNDDLFYGVFSEENIWREAGKIIGRPSHELRVINAVTGKEDVFKENNRYFYNFVNQKNVLRYNKYEREGTHYTYLTNDVIVNNYQDENNDVYPYKEEFTKEKLRVGYIDLGETKTTKVKFDTNDGISRKQIEDAVIETGEGMNETLYYVFDGGTLKAKLKNLSDGINEIRDNYGYVKLNDRITCYNRANKGNVSYLRQKDTILENLEGFEENVYLKDNKTLVMNVTGVTERDLEYYISLNEKVAVYKYDLFQFFITGYDNNNYVLEYPSGERVLTPRDEVKNAVIYGGYVLFAQLENLE